MTSSSNASAVALAPDEARARAAREEQGPEGQNRAPALEAASPATTAAVLVALAGAIGVIYARAWPELIRVWDIDPNYSHGYIVPVASLAFAWLAWQQAGSPVRRVVGVWPTTKGITEVLVGLALHIPAWFLGNLLLDVLSLICVLRGLLLILGGSEANRAYGFAALFLIFMAPLPMRMYQPLAIMMQQWVSGISTEFLTICNIPAYREGYYIHLPGYTMEVGEACSGLRQLTAVLALSVAIGHLSQKTTLYRWSLALLSVPIAIFANCLRVMITGLILIAFGPEWAEGVYHTLEGLVIVGLAAILVVGAAWGLNKIEDWFKRGEQSSISE